MDGVRVFLIVLHYCGTIIPDQTMFCQTLKFAHSSTHVFFLFAYWSAAARLGIEPATTCSAFKQELRVRWRLHHTPFTCQASQTLKSFYSHRAEIGTSETNSFGRVYEMTYTFSADFRRFRFCTHDEIFVLRLHETFRRNLQSCIRYAWHIFKLQGLIDKTKLSSAVVNSWWFDL